MGALFDSRQVALLGRARVGLGAHVVARRVVLRLHGRLAPRAHGAGRLVVAVVLLVPVAVVVVVPLVTTLVVEVRLRRCTSDWATNRWLRRLCIYIVVGVRSLHSVACTV